MSTLHELLERYDEAHDLLKVVDGIQYPLSVGYKIHRMVDDHSTTPITRRAVDWEPLEVSLVPISAEEVGTGFRTAA